MHKSFYASRLYYKAFSALLIWELFNEVAKITGYASIKEMGNFFQVPINYFAVFSSAISAMVIGFLWYGPIFGKQWSKIVGLTAEKIEKSKKEMPKTYGLMFAASVVMAYTLAHFVWYAAPGSLTTFIAVKTAVWSWLGFIATTSLSRFLFSPEKKPLMLLVIDAGYYLVVLVVMGVIFSVL